MAVIAEHASAPPPPALDKQVIESDFSPRKMKVATAILIGQTFATSLLPYGAFSLLMIPMTKEFGWSRTEFSFASTFLFIFGAVSLWPLGRITDRFGARPVILIGSAIVGLLTLAMSLQTRSLPQLYLYYGLLGVCGSTGVAYSKIIASLFTQHRGKALAILGAESAAAMAVVPLIINALMLNLGWRHMYLVLGAIILAVVPLLYFTLDEPGRSRGPGRAGARQPAPPPVVFEGMTIGQTLRDGVFWLIVVSGLAGMVIFSGMLTHMVAALIGKGFTQTQAVEATSISTVVGLGGTLLGGWLVDRFHTTKVAAPFNLLSIVSAFLLMILSAASGGMPLLIGAMALYGVAFNAHRPMATYFQTRFFGLKSFTEIASVQFTITNPVTAFAAPLIGMIYDQTHSYRIAFILMMIAPVISGVVWLILPKYRYSADIGAMPAPEKG
jgi:MFS family permease